MADNTPPETTNSDKRALTTIAATLKESRKSVDASQRSSRSAILNILLNLRRERLTPVGFNMLGLFMLAAILGLASVNVQVYWVATLLLAFVLIPTVTLAPRARAKRQIATRSKAGSVLDYTVEVENTGRGHIFDLVLHEVALPDPIRGTDARDVRGAADPLTTDASDLVAARLIPQLAPGERARVPMALVLPKRGFYRLNRLRVESLFPFGIWRRGRYQRDAVDDILVFPKFTPLDRLELPMAQRYQPGGIALTSKLGESPEFLGIREYRAGDHPRNIDWRSWARTGKPAVKEYQEEYFCRVALVVDTQLPGSGRAAEDCVEAGISMAAAVADSLSRQETIIDVFAAGPNLYKLQAGRNLAFLENILEVLACIEATREYPFQLVVPELLEDISQIASVVFVLLDWDSHRAQFVQSTCDLGCAVKTIVVRDGPCTDNPAEIEALTGRRPILLTPKDVEDGPTVL